MPTLTPGHELLGRYRLGRKIGFGGMGSIFVAQDLSLNRPVAVKFMSAQFVDQTDLRARFEREARTAAGLRSAHIVEVFDVGSVEGTPFMVMELLEGEDLGVRMRSAARMSVDAVVSVVMQAARGLEVAHRAGVVHRDIKPANLFLARQGETEVVKVLDFGIAKSPTTMGESTLTDETLGSPHYMSPEQAKGAARVDSRADVWSLGVVAYRLLAGVPPFDGPGAGAIFVALCTEPHPAMSRVRPDLPAELDAFFDRALAKDPAERFPSALALAADLANTLGRTASIPTLDPFPAATSGSAPRTPVTTAPIAAAPMPTTPVARQDVERTLTEVVSPVFPRPHKRRVGLWIASAMVIVVGMGAGGFAAARMRASETTASPREPAPSAQLGDAAPSAPGVNGAASAAEPRVEITVASGASPSASAADSSTKPRPNGAARTTPMPTSPTVPNPTVANPIPAQPPRTAAPTASSDGRIKLGI